MKRTFTAGDTGPAGDCDKFEAGIHVHTPGGNDGTSGAPWWQRIVVYGDTPADAEALRNEVLTALNAGAYDEAKERELFEGSYRKEFEKARGYPVSAEEITDMRIGDGYRTDRAYLNGQWDGWKARALLGGDE